MIVFESVRKRYPEFEISVDLSIAEGELVSILGPSGSGKTTTLRLIAGFAHPDSGKILIDGRDVTALPPAQRKIGYVFQDYTLFPHMSVAANVGYGLRVRHRSAGEIEERVEDLLRVVDLAGYGPRPVTALSGGERQRVAIARALAVEPVMLLLDEPFSSIDEVLRRELRDEIVRLQRELAITVVFVTHSRQEALAISDRVAVLHDGRVEQYAPPEELYYRPVNTFVAGFVGDWSVLPGTKTLRRPEQLAIVSDAATDINPQGVRAEAVRATIIGRQFQGSTYRYTAVAVDRLGDERRPENGGSFGDRDDRPEDPGSCSPHASPSETLGQMDAVNGLEPTPEITVFDRRRIEVGTEVRVAPVN